MTNEQINIAIAKACGWYEKDNESEICWTRDELTYCLHEDKLPNYCNELNAMHEAEKTLNNITAAEYARILTSIAWQSDQPVYAPITATSRQRAEAFLKTIGKWEEAK